MGERRVLVTGASGCMGRALVPMLLARGHEVHALARQRPHDADPRVHWHAGDLLAGEDAAALVRHLSPDTLVHLAWYVAPGRWAAAPVNVQWVEASLHLVQAFAAAGGRRAVMAGSCLEYDWQYGYCQEARTPYAPHTLYGTSKHALRLLVQGLAGAAGVSWAWGRVFFLHGPYEHPDRLVPSVMRSLLRGQTAAVSHGRQVRDYLHVDDVARAFDALVESDAHGDFNVCSGEAVSLRSIVETIGTLAGPSADIAFGAVPAAMTDVPLVVGDPSRLREATGWAPRMTLRAGLADTWAWWQQREGQEERA